MCTFREILDEHKEYLRHAPDSDMEELTDLISDFVEVMREHHPTEVEVFLEEVEESVSPYLDEEMAKEFVHSMKNKDGTHGGKWTPEQTEDVRKKYHVESDWFGTYDWYAAMNMVYSDHYKSSRGLEDYIELAKDFLCDEDWGPGKMKEYVSLKMKHTK